MHMGIHACFCTFNIINYAHALLHTSLAGMYIHACKHTQHQIYNMRRCKLQGHTFCYNTCIVAESATNKIVLISPEI